MNKNAPRDGGETDTSAILVFDDDDDDDGTREEDIAVALATAAFIETQEDEVFVIILYVIR